jgi:hypothetical protein
MGKADRFTVRDAPGGRGYLITCSECGETDTVQPNGRAGTMPPQIIQQKFRQKGWNVGSTHRKDLCPECNGAKEVKAYTVDKNLRVEPKDIQRPTNVIQITKEPAVATPMQISRDDRRIILAKLNEVYLDETTGYRPGWSDNRVADDLGVMSTWVSQLRLENFGDLGVSALDAQIREEAAKIRDALQELELQVMEVLQTMQGRMEELASQRQALEAKLNPIINAAA